MSRDFTPGPRNRSGRRSLTDRQQALADELTRRAAVLRADSDGELSIAEAVELAAFQIGAEHPQTRTDILE